MKTFHLHSVGCKTNQSESDHIASNLIRKGYRFVDIAGGPDIAIINTCTVTSAADKKVRQYIRKTRALNPSTIIIATGCYTVFNSAALKNLGVDIIVSNKDKLKIPDIITKDSMAVPDTISSGQSLLNYSSLIAQHSRALVKIQDGCQQKCSYCIVPLVRGRYRSVEPSSVLKQVRDFAGRGYDEVVFTGIHIGKYGKGEFIDEKARSIPGKSGNSCKNLPGKSCYNLSGKIPGDLNFVGPPANLASLLKNTLENTPVRRIRLSSIEINEIDEELISVIKSGNGRIARHLHVPLQSGSDKILEAMNRKYSYEFFAETISRLKNEIPQITFTTDIIVGFPDETEEDFNCTIKAMEDTGFTKTHVFKYSRRENTEAFKMDFPVDERTRAARSKIARELGEKLRQEYTGKFIGRQLGVVCETFDEGKKIACGTSENYIKVYFNMDVRDFQLKRCRIVQVMVEKRMNSGLFGHII